MINIPSVTIQIYTYCIFSICAAEVLLAWRLSALPEVLHNSYNTGTSNLPDMYVLNLNLSPQAAPLGFRHAYKNKTAVYSHQMAIAAFLW